MSKEKIEMLVQEFADASAQFEHFSSTEQYKITNKYAKKMHSIYKKIKGIGDDGRDELAKLMYSDNKGIAKMAAVYSLAYRTEDALKVLEEIANLSGALGTSAKHAIARWNEGEWHLDEE